MVIITKFIRVSEMAMYTIHILLCLYTRVYDGHVKNSNSVALTGYRLFSQGVRKFYSKNHSRSLQKGLLLGGVAEKRFKSSDKKKWLDRMTLERCQKGSSPGQDRTVDLMMPVD
jgi:hypothetical protein